MNKKLQKLLVLFITALSLSFNAKATHLMGGNMYYEYLGLGPNGYDYHVTLKIYRYCCSTCSNLPNSIQLGAYIENPSLPLANKVLQSTYTMPLVSQQVIQPPNANDSCAFLPNECVEEGIYEIDITLPASTGGYQLIAQLCCRNQNIVNVDNPGGTGMVWYAFVPPTSTNNSSPTFSVAPVPYICANDTVSILNAANDPDGDLLVYNFVWPYAGLSNGGNPAPAPPAVYPWPITDIAYAPTYSFPQPFGAGGYAAIDTATGLTSYLSPSQGFFVVAVEIREYRNGVLVGITRRDLQLIFIACPINPAPVTTNSTFTYNINEGDTLCFNVGFNDPNADSLFLTHSGDIFNSNLTNPTATMSNVAGIGSVSTQFCWGTSCDQGRTTPYQFSATASDNGCPPKITNVVFTINVAPFHGTQNINGPDSICGNGLNGIVYSTSGQPNSTFQWTLQNGTQVTGGTTNTISVNWGANGPYSISVCEINSKGCHGDTILKNIAISPIPTANAGPNQTFCSGLSANIGTTSTPGYTYSWSPASGLSSSTASNPSITLTNTGANPVLINYVVTTNLNGCTNKDTVTITVNPEPISNAGSNQFLCSGSSLTIGGPSTPGYTYAWSPSTGLSSTTVAGPSTTLSNAPDTIVYTVVTSNSFNCTSSDIVQIIVRELPIVAAAANPLTVCAGQQVTLTATGASTYSWATLTNPGTQIGTGSLLIVNPTVSTSYIVTGTNAQNCQNKDTIAITVNALPNVIANAAPDSICLGDTVSLNATGANTYSWATLTNPGVPIGTGTSISVSPATTTSYIVTGTATSTGCENKDTITVHIVLPPVSNAGPDKPLCSGNTVTIGTAPVPGSTYAWSPSTGLSSTTVSNPTVNLTNIGNVPDTSYYTVITTNAFGCTSTDEVMIIINPVPTANAGTDVIFCSGQSATIGATAIPGYTYSWSPTTGLSPTNGSNPTITLTNSGTVNDTLYYLVTTTWFGCTDIDTVRVIVKPLPTVNAGPNQTICSGDTVQLGTTSTPGYTYSWSPSTNLSATNISNPTAALTSTGGPTTYTYTVVATWNGCTNEDSVQILVNNLPNVLVAALPQSICVGDSTTLAATGASTYAWALASNPSVIIGTGPTLTVSPPTTVTFIVTGTSSVNCENSATITVTVNPLPPVIATAPSDSICAGDSINLTGNGATSYQWEIQGQSGVISNNQVVTVSPSGATNYVVTGTDANGCHNSDTITVYVNPAATLSGIFGVDYACPGVTGVPYWVINPNPTSSYTWTVSGGTIASGQGTDTIYVDWGATGVGLITCVETTDHGCESSIAAFSVNINPVLTPPQPSGLTPLCANLAQGIVYSTLNTPGSIYTWNISGGTIVSGQGTNSITVNWNPTGPAVGILWFNENSSTIDTVCFGVSDTLLVTINPVPQTSAITGPTALCQNDSNNFSVTNTSGSTYQWNVNNGSLLNGQGTNQIGAQWTTAGNFTVNVVETNQYGCIGDTVTYNILINPLPVANAGTDTAICVGDATHLHGSGGSQYNWSPSGSLNNSTVANPWATPTSTTTYTVVVTDGNGCSNSDNVDVIVNPLPIINAGADVSVCRGSSVQLNATGGVNYTWKPSNGLSATNIANPVASPFNTITYIVTGTDGNACKNKDSIVVTVNPVPVVTASTLNDTICNGSSTTLNANGANNYSWSPSGSLNDPNLQNPVASPSSTTVYTVVGTDQNGCKDTNTVIVNINPQPVAGFSFYSKATCEGTKSVFTNESTDGLSYFWNFGDGSTGGAIDPVHMYSYGFTGNVTLVAINGDCSDTIVQNIATDLLSDIEDKIPNVFTPNGDGINDCFSLDSLGDFRKCTEYTIWDRWGRKIYTSDLRVPSKRCWDGRGLNNEDAADGTYLYVIDVAGLQFKGMVLLLRNK